MAALVVVEASAARGGGHRRRSKWRQGARQSGAPQIGVAVARHHRGRGCSGMAGRRDRGPERDAAHELDAGEARHLREMKKMEGVSIEARALLVVVYRRRAAEVDLEGGAGRGSSRQGPPPGRYTETRSPVRALGSHRTGPRRSSERCRLRTAAAMAWYSMSR
ncbi:uncharacterized protein M6B38_122445 [Iris pallida]|uniref:Uncharacterized protein n=1 Tax=Iris pallida TaxID=29817 RepID=A0AAX6F650_IRIPA|nr:uncharacterized protein M6B38_153030 [Iris pallida]KAJ6837677.1 uncharacterized protein M6B38_122445 [Iris pallida]